MNDRKAELERKKERLRQIREEKERRRREREQQDARVRTKSKAHPVWDVHNKTIRGLMQCPLKPLMLSDHA